MATSGVTESLPRSRVRFGVLGFTSSLALITYLDRVCIMRAKPDIQGALQINDNQMGLVFSAFLLGYALFEVPGGWLGDAWGSRSVLTWIVAWWSLFTALTGCVWYFSLDGGWRIVVGSHALQLVFDSFVVLLSVRFLFGAGEAGAFPNITRVLGSWFPSGERGFAQGSVWMAARIGGAIAPFVLGRLSAAVGWRQAFWILGVIGFAWCFAFYAWFRDSPADKPSCNAAERTWIGAADRNRAGSKGHAWPPWRRLAFSVSAWALCVASCGVSFGWYFFPTWQPEYLKTVHKIGYDDSEIITGLPFLFGALGCLAGGGLSDWIVRRTGSRRWGRSLVGFAGFGGAGLCVLASGFVTAAWQAVALLCLAFLINDLAIPAIWATCADIGGRFAGTVAGVMNMAGGLGAIISPMLIPRILQALPTSYSDVMRWRIIFAGLAVAWFLAALACLFIDAGKPLFASAGGSGHHES
jgi:MFS family permease